LLDPTPDCGVGPVDACEDLKITVIASDVDGMQATSCFVVRRVQAAD
jgi:hypothetical protein